MSQMENEVTTEEPVDFNKTRFIENTAGNKQLARALITIFMQEFPKQFQSLIKAVSAKTHRDVQFIAHSMKGRCNMVGAFKLSQLASDIEGLSLQKDQTDWEKIIELTKQLETGFETFKEAIKSFDF